MNADKKVDLHAGKVEAYPMREETHAIMLNYLRVTRLPIGLILNFKHARLEWERIVLSENLRPSASIGG